MKLLLGSDCHTLFYSQEFQFRKLYEVFPTEYSTLQNLEHVLENYLNFNYGSGWIFLFCGGEEWLESPLMAIKTLF